MLLHEIKWHSFLCRLFFFYLYRRMGFNTFIAIVLMLAAIEFQQVCQKFG